MNSKKNILLCMLITLLNSCENPGSSKADQGQAREVFTTWLKEVNETKSEDAYFRHLASEFVMMECGYDPVSNRDTVKANLRNLFNVDLQIEDWKSDELIIRDDIAIHRHSGTEVVVVKSDTIKQRYPYNYLDILKKDESGDWKIYIHVSLHK